MRQSAARVRRVSLTNEKTGFQQTLHTNAANCYGNIVIARKYTAPDE